MLHFVASLVNIWLYFIYFYTGVLGTTVVNVEPKNGNVTERSNITLSCLHSTDSIYNYTIAWLTGSSSEKIAGYRTTDHTISIEMNFVEHFDAIYSSSAGNFTLILTNASWPVHNQEYKCEVNTVEDGLKIGYFKLLVYFIRRGLVTPPAHMTDRTSTNFTCDAEGQPDPTYQWKIGSDDTISNLCDINSGSYLCSEDGSNLFIGLVDFLIHNTSFFCEASNEVGTEESEPSIPNEDFDFFYCVTEEMPASGDTCSKMEFRLSVKSYPERIVHDEGVCKPDGSDDRLLCPFDVGWLETTKKFNHTCNNSIAVRTFPYSRDHHKCIEEIVGLTIGLFVGVVLIIAIFCIICKGSPGDITESNATASELTVGWAASSHAFIVEWRESKSGSKINRKEVDENFVTLEDLKPLTEYKISVKRKGMFKYSKTITVCTKDLIALKKAKS